MNRRARLVGLGVAAALVVGGLTPAFAEESTAWKIGKVAVKLALGGLSMGGGALGDLIGKIPGLPGEIKDILAAFTTKGFSAFARSGSACVDKANGFNSGLWSCLKAAALDALKVAGLE